MKALLLKRYSKSNPHDVGDIPQPTIQADEILVRVHAAGLNPIDNMISRGMFKPILKFTLPAIVGSDLAGTVVETGRLVTRFKPGDAIYASLFDLDRGALAEYVAVPEKAAALKPESIDFVEAASLPMVALTSWQAFTEEAKLQPGQKVFIPAGSGGIGTFAIQLAKHLGAIVGTTTSTGNVEWVKALGADEVIDYRSAQFETLLHDYDRVLGTIRGDSIEKALEILKPQGKVVSLIGPPDPAFARRRGMNAMMRALFWLLSRNIVNRAKKRNVDYAFLFVRPDGGQLAEIAGLIDAGSIRPVIDKVFSFEDARRALAYLAGGRAKGKVVIRMTE